MAQSTPNIAQWDWNPGTTFVGAAKAAHGMMMANQESERLQQKQTLDEEVARTMLPHEVELAKAKIASVQADIGLKGAQAKYYADGKSKAATLLQERLGVAGTIQPLSFYSSEVDDEPQGVEMGLRSNAPTLNRAPVDTEDTLLENGPLSMFRAEEGSGDIIDFSTLPDNAKLVSSGSGMDSTTANAMNNASAAMGGGKAGAKFDLAAVADTFYPKMDKQSVSGIKDANEQAGVRQVDGLKNRSALASYEQENAKPALARIAERFDTSRAQAKAFVDVNKDSYDLNAWAQAQAVEAGAGQAVNKFDNDLRRGGYGITAAQVDRVLEKYPANYAAVDQIAPYLQGSGDIDLAMARYEQDKTNRLEGDKQRVARVEKLRDSKISILGQSGELTDEKKSVVAEIDRQLDLIRSPQEKLSEFSAVNTEAQSLARGWAKNSVKPTTNHRGEPIESASDKITHGQKFEELVFKGGIPVADAKVTDQGLDGNWNQVAMWFKEKGMEMPENTPVTTGVYINNSLVPVRVSYTKGKNGAEFSAQPLVPLQDQSPDKGKEAGKTAPATKYDEDAIREQKDSAFSAAKKQKEELEREIGLLGSRAENVPDFTNKGFWGPFAENVSDTLGVKVSGQATTAADKQKIAQGYVKKSTDLKLKLAGIKEKFPELFK